MSPSSRPITSSASVVCACSQAVRNASAGGRRSEGSAAAGERRAGGGMAAGGSGRVVASGGRQVEERRRTARQAHAAQRHRVWAGGSNGGGGDDAGNGGDKYRRRRERQQLPPRVLSRQPMRSRILCVCRRTRTPPVRRARNFWHSPSNPAHSRYPLPDLAQQQHKLREGHQLFIFQSSSFRGRCRQTANDGGGRQHAALP